MLVYEIKEIVQPSPSVNLIAVSGIGLGLHCSLSIGQDSVEVSESRQDAPTYANRDHPEVQPKWTLRVQAPLGTWASWKNWNAHASTGAYK